MAGAEEITYTPDELAEIERIVDFVERSGRRSIAPPETYSAPVEEETGEMREEPPGEESFHPAPESFEGEPVDLALPAVDLDELTGGKQPLPAPEAEAPLPVDDITDLIHEVEEEFPVVSEETPPERPGPPPETPGELSALEELDSLTSDEPISLDAGDLAPVDSYVGPGEPPRAKERIVDQKPEPPLEDISMDEFGAIEEAGDIGELPTGPAPTAEGVSLAGGEGEDIPDLSEISFDDGSVMPEVKDADIPDMDLGVEAMSPAESSFAEEPAVDDFSDEDLSSIESIGDFPEERELPPSRDIIQDVSEKMKATSAVEDSGLAGLDLPSVEEEPFEVEMLEDEPKKTAPAKKTEAPGGGVDLSDRDMVRLKRALLLFNASIRQAVKDVVINDLLSPRETKQLINMILSGRSESDVHRHLEGKLKRKIALADEAPLQGRRVLTSRPEYTLAGRDRQRRVLRTTRIFGIAAIVTCALAIGGYHLVYKPFMAKRMIRQGTALIRESGDYVKKQKDYTKAEELFGEVDEDYIRDYLYGYTEYANAYFDRKEYNASLKKLNRIYGILNEKGRAIDNDLLNALGRYYSKVPPQFYNAIRLNIDTWYYPGSEKKREEWPQLEVAIEFYRRALLRDGKDVAALYGIGNAYFLQGEFLKAKKYYEDIIDIDPDSEVGYSGLLNLYVERDVFEKVVEVHSRLTEKKLLPDVPSPLLAKLASYYLDKQKTAEMNVRIDYGVQSPRFKDSDDNIYPAVYAVLQALNKRDSEYPPLHLQYARLNRAQNNLKVMKIHLEKAISLSRKNYGADYFGALHLMGEYYYSVKEPAKAYEMLNRAIRAAQNPPEFTREDFYRETESTGKTYALLGNIFYYYFDRVTLRYGDLEDETIESEMDRLANYQIAREKYEKALEEGFQSPEVHYNLGRTYYLNRLYRKALEQWLNLYEDFVQRPELIFALGNAFYHMGNYGAAKGEYLKLISTYEHDIDRKKALRPDTEGVVKMVTFLSSSYNNLGAVYQVQNNEAKSDLSYWKAINYAQRINLDNEFARVNLARSFKRSGEIGEPILDESIPYSIDYYREELRR
ncbi:MAG: tetratricopeptide repeat protein [Spirochaetes bacterium]|nr:tetratricopeptide repeat protein [Spirochaetota bacterium]